MRGPRRSTTHMLNFTNQKSVREREAAIAGLQPWSGGQVWDAPHHFKPWDNAMSQCGRCWGWVDDWRHLALPRSR